MNKIYLAGGCFWGLQGYFDGIVGVVKTVVGYANGTGNPKYEDVCRGNGYAETICVEYENISLNQILQYYFRVIDPISINRQGNDTGIQYRTGIYYTDENQKKEIEDFIQKEQKKYDKMIVVEVEPLKNFYPAEDYHQKYLEKNPTGYCHIDINKNKRKAIDPNDYKKLSDLELREKLTPFQYAITQENATEPPFENEFYDNTKKGIYVDITTGEPLFSSDDQFLCSCGWASFTHPIAPEVVNYRRDISHGMDRIEVRSRVGDAHLGHVFNDGPNGNLRYCINSAALKFIPKK